MGIDIMKEATKQYNSLKEIPSRKYEGYVWMSNCDHPNVLDGQSEYNSFQTNDENPFIIEALLFDQTSNTSIMVKHTGRYIINEYDLSKIPSNAKQVKEYLSHKIDNINKLVFYQIWLPEADSLCEGMEVLKLKGIIFTGFQN